MALWLPQGSAGGLDIEALVSEKEKGIGWWHLALCRESQAVLHRALGDLGFPTSWPSLGLCLSTHTPSSGKADGPFTGLRTRAAWLGGRAQQVLKQRLSQNASLAFGTRHGWAKTWKEKLLAAWLSLSFLLCISTLRVDETRCGQEVWVYSQWELVGFSPASCRETGSGSSASSPGPSDFLPGVCGVAVGYPLDTVKVRQEAGLRRPSKGPWLGLGCPPSLLHPPVARDLSGLLIRPALPTLLRTMSAPLLTCASGFLSYMGLLIPALPTVSMHMTFKALARPLPQAY